MRNVRQNQITNGSHQWHIVPDRRQQPGDLLLAVPIVERRPHQVQQHRYAPPGQFLLLVTGQIFSLLVVQPQTGDVDGQRHQVRLPAVHAVPPDALQVHHRLQDVHQLGGSDEPTLVLGRVDRRNFVPQWFPRAGYDRRSSVHLAHYPSGALQQNGLVVVMECTGSGGSRLSAVCLWQGLGQVAAVQRRNGRVLDDFVAPTAER